MATTRVYGRPAPVAVEGGGGHSSVKNPSLLVDHCPDHGEKLFTRIAWFEGENSIRRRNPLPPLVEDW